MVSIVTAGAIKNVTVRTYKGPFTNYVSMFFVIFDPLPPWLAIVSIWVTPLKNYVRFCNLPLPKIKMEIKV